jgi:tetratricopeptide (TPR) repeat protein
MSQESENFQELMNLGHSAAWEKEWKKALEAYQAALQIAPLDAMALGSAGLACFNLNLLDESLQYYKQCATVTPDDPMPYEKMGHIFEHLQLTADAVKAFMHAAEKQIKARNANMAIKALKEAARLDPTQQSPHLRLAMIYDKMGLKKESAVEYLNLAAIMQTAGDHEKAMQAVQYSIKLDPQNTSAQKALEMLKTGNQLSISPPDPQVVTLTNAREQSPQKQAAPLVETTPDYDPLTEGKLAALKELAGVLFEAREDGVDETPAPRRSFNLLNWGTGQLSGKHLDRSRMREHLNRAIDLQTAGKDNEAAVELERAIGLGLDLPAADYLYAYLIYQRNAQKAIKQLQKSVRVATYALPSFLLMAKLKRNAKQTKEACLNFLQALKTADIQTLPETLENEMSQLYEPIIETQLQEQDEKKLDEVCQLIEDQLARTDWREYFKQVRGHIPSSSEAGLPTPLAEMLLDTGTCKVIEQLANIKNLATDGKLRAAMEEAFYAVTCAPYYLPLHIQIGELLIQEGQTSEAVEKFIHAATLYNLKGETGQAVRLLTRVSNLAPMNLDIKAMLIDLLITHGSIDDAIKQYMEIANVHYLLAELDLAKGQYQQAFALANRSKDPQGWAMKILNKLADIELQSLDLKEAVKILEQLRNLAPSDASTRATLVALYLRIGLVSAAMNELDAYLKLLDSTGQHHSAERFLENLLEEKPDNIEIQQRLIGFYQAQNRAAEVVEKLDALAEKCLRLENKEGALATRQNIISLNPSNANDYRRLY